MELGLYTFAEVDPPSRRAGPEAPRGGWAS